MSVVRTLHIILYLLYVRCEDTTYHTVFVIVHITLGKPMASLLNINRLNIIYNTHSRSAEWYVAVISSGWSLGLPTGITQIGRRNPERGGIWEQTRSRL